MLLKQKASLVISAVVLLTSCNMAEKSRFLSTLSKISNMRSEISSKLDTVSEKGPFSSKEEWLYMINSEVSKSISMQIYNNTVNLYAPNLPNYKIGKPVHEPGVIYIDIEHIFIDKTVQITASVIYPGTDYLVEINRSIQADPPHFVSPRPVEVPILPLDQDNFPEREEDSKSTSSTSQ